MALIKVANVSDLPEGSMKKVEASGESIVLINIKNKIYALQAYCTHKKGPLWEGEIEEEVLICPWHAARFDILTGKAQKETSWATDLKKYEVKLKDGDIYVDV